MAKQKTKIQIPADLIEMDCFRGTVTVRDINNLIAWLKIDDKAKKAIHRFEVIILPFLAKKLAKFNLPETAIQKLAGDICELLIPSSEI